MSSTTKYKISEQILLRLNSGDKPAGSNVEMQEVQVLVGQMINKLLKTEYFAVHLATGEENGPNGMVTAVYENVPVLQYGEVSKSVLPAMPVKILKNMGVWHVSRPGDHADPFIPIPNGMAAMMRGEPLISDVLGQISYEQFGSNLVYNKNLIAEGIPEVMMKLVVVNVDDLEEFDPLPIPADMEVDVVNGVYEMLAGKPQGDRLNDSTAEKQRVPGQSQTGGGK